MRLKRLEITGFKSFYDKCRLDFPSGITAIVGPNGCGKSNIVDALRWVMGEQSVKQLRGKAMEDVIFSGTNGTAPLNMAEVNLIMANDNGSAPEELRDFTEIMLTRRLYRSGESAYLLNKQPCRLKDIRNVFLGSGMGTKSYAMIQQGSIGAITEAGPEERRYFVEEAAGTTRFKTRKMEALRKIKATKRNLLRLDDLMVEIKRQMNSLKRQVGKARRYKKFRALARTIDIRLNLLRYNDHEYRISETERLLDELKNTGDSQVFSMKKIDAAMEEIKLNRQQKNQQIADQKSNRFDLQRTLDRSENTRAHLHQEADRLTSEITELESAGARLKEKNIQLRIEIDQTQSQINHLDEKIDALEETIHSERDTTVSVRRELDILKQALETAKTDLMDQIAQEARYKNIHQHASNNKENLQQRLKIKGEEEQIAKKETDQCRHRRTEAQHRLKSLGRHLADIDAQLETIRRELDAKTADLSQQLKTVQKLDLNRNQTTSRHADLKKMEDNFEWYRDGVRAIMTLKKQTLSSASVQQKPVTDPTNTLAAGVIALTADVIVPEPSYEVAVEAVLGDALQYVLVNDQQSGLLAIDYLKRTKAGRGGFIPANSLEPNKSDSAGKSSAFRPLLDYVTVKEEFEDIAQLLLGQVDLAEDLTDALQHFNRNETKRTIVTRSGDIVSRRGILVGGGSEKLGGILAKKQEIKQLGKQLASLDQEINSARSTQTEIENDVKAVENRLQKLTVTKHRISEDKTDAEKTLFKAEEALKNVARRFEIIQLEQEQLFGEEADLDEEISKYDRALADVTRKVKTSQEVVSNTSARIQSVSEQMEKINRREMDLKLELTSFKAQRENHRNSFRRLDEFQSDQETRYGQLISEIETKINKKTAAKEKAGEIKQSLDTMYQQLEHANAQIDHYEKDYHAFDIHLKENEDRIADIRDHHERTLKETRLLEVELSELTINQKNIADRLKERYHKTISGFRREIEALAQENPKDRYADRSPEELASELSELERKISVLGDVNMGAISEYQTLETRYDFLTKQREDLVNAIDGLYRVIRKINRITQKRFNETMASINEQLKVVFPKLFEGGVAKLVLTEPDKPLESGVEYMIQPPGKRLTQMSLLSGGEKALSAIAFIFSIFLIRPASFCFLDEIDAPLDEANILRFNELIKTIGERSQIVMITHNKKSMEFAEMLFGITMPKKGVSKIVSANFNQAEA